MERITFVVPVLAALVGVKPPNQGASFDLVKVRDEARQLRQTLPAGERVEIVFAPGVYTVTNTLIEAGPVPAPGGRIDGCVVLC